MTHFRLYLVFFRSSLVCCIQVQVGTKEDNGLTFPSSLMLVSMRIWVTSSCQIIHHRSPIEFARGPRKKKKKNKNENKAKSKWPSDVSNKCINHIKSNHIKSNQMKSYFTISRCSFFMVDTGGKLPGPVVRWGVRGEGVTGWIWSWGIAE
jgi:hypothetical protein